MNIPHLRVLGGDFHFAANYSAKAADLKETSTMMGSVENQPKTLCAVNDCPTFLKGQGEYTKLR